MADAGPLTRIDNVSKSFGGLLAVDRVSLEIEAGSFFALLGPSAFRRGSRRRFWW